MSGYHIREAGATALQELAFTLRDGIEYVQWGVDAGLDVDDFVPRMSFFFNAHSDFFEEIAKYRAARKIWARVMRERFGAKDERSLEAALPHADGRRVAHGAAALQQRRAHGAAGARPPCSAARTRCTPIRSTRRWRCRRPRPPRSRCARSRSSRTRAASPNVVDPLGGSYFVERLTLDMEEGAYRYFDTIDRMGGMVAAIEQGFPQREIAESAYRFQQAVEAREKLIVGVNAYVEDDEAPVPILYIDESAAEAQMARLDDVRAAPRSGPGGAVARGAARTPRGAPATRWCPCSSASARTRRSARCATRSGRCGASTRKSRQSSDDFVSRHGDWSGNRA